MSTNLDFVREWKQVKSELMKLKGCTIASLAGKSESHIENIDEEWGIRRRSRDANRSQDIDWDRLENAYRELYESGRLIGGTGTRIGYGAFCLAVFALLSTADVAKDGRKTILKYVANGRPPRLKEG